MYILLEIKPLLHLLTVHAGLGFTSCGERGVSMERLAEWDKMPIYGPIWGGPFGEVL
jgi:hypothetical protein